jgi:hypothetical protein
MELENMYGCHYVGRGGLNLDILMSLSLGLQLATLKTEASAKEQQK